MSYFFGMPVQCSDIPSYHENSEKKKNEDQLSIEDFHLDNQSSSRRQRIHSSSRSQCQSKIKSTSNAIRNSRSLSSKAKHKHHARAHGVVNQGGKFGIHVTTPESGFIEGNIEKETLLAKYKNKCSKLQINFLRVHEKNIKLQNLLEMQESEYKNLYANYEELLQQVRIIEREKKNIVTRSENAIAANRQLNEDITLLKILIYRLNVELERYQDKLRLPDEKYNDVIFHNIADEQNSTFEKEKLVESWGRVNIHVLGPLIEAYQENINEKKILITQFRREYDDFGRKCKEVIAENEELRKDIENHKFQTDKLVSEMKMLVDDALIVKNENDLLIKQATLHKHKLHEVHTIYEKKFEAMSQDNNKLHENHIACRDELSNLRGKYEILLDDYERLKKNSEKTMPVSLHLDTVEECKRLFEELKQQYNKDKGRMLSHIKKFEESNPENEKIIATLTVERNHLKQLTKNLEKNLKRTQKKCELIHNTMYSVEISRDSYKQQLAIIIVYCEKLIAEQEKLLRGKENLLMTLHKREKRNESIKYLGTAISQRMDILKNQLKDVEEGARQQLETVNNHIKTQKVGIGQLKTDYHRELERLKQLVKQKENVIGKLQREKYATQDNLELVWKAAISEDKMTTDVLKQTKIHNV